MWTITKTKWRNRRAKLAWGVGRVSTPPAVAVLLNALLVPMGRFPTSLPKRVLPPPVHNVNLAATVSFTKPVRKAGMAMGVNRVKPGDTRRAQTTNCQHASNAPSVIPPMARLQMFNARNAKKVKH